MGGTKENMKSAVSVSKRSDIPCWHPEWFMNRMRAGTVTYKNPMGPQIVNVSLKKEDVSAIVFWTKNFKPMMKHMEEFQGFGIPFYTHWTLNDYPKEYEANVGAVAGRIESFKELANLGSPVFWRYDPIILSAATNYLWHIMKFGEIAAALEGHTDRCYISFLDLYAKTVTNMKHMPSILKSVEPSLEEKDYLTEKFKIIAARYGITLMTCAEAEVTTCTPGACIDPQVIKFISGEKSLAGSGNRPGCNCAKHRDIGAYDTCASGCSYCYAVNSQEAAARFIKNESDPTGVSLVRIP